MKLGQVIGNAVLSKCIPQYEGKILHLVHDLNGQRVDISTIFVD